MPLDDSRRNVYRSLLRHRAGLASVEAAFDAYSDGLPIQKDITSYFRYLLIITTSILLVL